MSNRNLATILTLIILALAAIYIVDRVQDGPLENFVEDVSDATDEVTNNSDIDIDID